MASLENHSAETAASKPSFPRSALNQQARNRTNFAAIRLLAIIASLVFWPWLFAGQAFYWGDFGLYFQPVTELLREQLIHGRLPLWNPYLFSGAPYIGNPQTWPIYPTSLLLFFFSVPVFLMVSLVLHVLLAGSGLFLLLHRGRAQLGLWPALLGAVTYMLGGFLVSKAQFPNMLQALAYVPLLLLFTEQLVQRPDARNALKLGIALGLQILAAHAQITVFSVYLMVLFGVWRFRVLENHSARALAQRFGWVLLSFALALALSCPQWLPVVEWTRIAGREQFSLAEAHRFVLWPQQLTNFFWPNRFGHPMRGNYAAPGNYWETACYVGIVPFVLALVGAATSFARRYVACHEARFWTSLGVASTLLAMGVHGLLYLFAFYFVPGVKVFHDPARFLLGAALAIPILAAIGLQRVLETWSWTLDTPRRMAYVSAVLLLVSCLDLGSFSRNIYPLKSVRAVQTESEASTLIRFLRTDTELANGRARVLFLDPQQHLNALLSYRDYMQRDPQQMLKWLETFPPNLPMSNGFLQAGGYEPVAMRSSKNAVRAVSEMLPQQENSRATEKASSEYSSRLGRMSVKYLVTLDRHPLRRTAGLSLFWTSAWQQDGLRVRVYRNQNFSARLQSLGTKVLLWREPSPNQIEVALAPSTREELLTLYDTAYPSWRAYADARPASLQQTAAGYRAITLPPGAQKVSLVCEPQSFRVGLFMALLALGTLAAFRCCGKQIASGQDASSEYSDDA